MRGGGPAGTGIHASAVAIGGQGLLLLGPSRAGKSRLAVALIAAATEAVPIMLVGDDRVLLTETDGRLVARPHPRIAGFIERRGLGLVAVPHVEAATVAGIVALGPTTPLPAPLQNFPGLRLVTSFESAASTRSAAEAVLEWWRGACTTPSRETPVGC